MKNLNDLINGENVYKNIKPKFLKRFNDPCTLRDHIFDLVLAKIPNPKLILEIGSWHGTSAIYMSKIIKQRELKTKIICIDTFLGSYFHRINDYWKPRLFLKRGRSRLYEDFLTNIVSNGVQDVVIPFVTTSLDAARFFTHYKISPDIVFIDGSHEEVDVYLDLINYWPILKTPGMIFGDDFSNSFLGVMQAVARFSAEVELPIMSYNDKFAFFKETTQHSDKNSISKV